MTLNRKATPFRDYSYVLVFFKKANHPNMMLNQPNCPTSLEEKMLLYIYAVLREASQMKTNNAFSVLVIKLSRFSSHLTRLRVASNRTRKYVSKQTRQTRIELTFRESPLSAHCPHVTIGKSATHQFVDMFYFSPDSLILFL